MQSDSSYSACDLADIAEECRRVACVGCCMSCGGSLQAGFTCSTCGNTGHEPSRLPARDWQRDHRDAQRRHEAIERDAADALARRAANGEFD